MSRESRSLSLWMLLRVVGPTRLQHLAVHADRRERGLELVAHGRDEVLLLPREPELADGKAIHEIEASAENGRERQ
jgi:hypothetical protein